MIGAGSGELLKIAGLLAVTTPAPMLAEGIKVGRHFDGYDTWARVTIGPHRDVDRFLRALPRALSEHRVPLQRSAAPLQ